KGRLGVMMFLEYFIWGAWYVTVGTWLSTTVHFNGQQVGLVAGTTAVSAIVAPFFVGLIADKLFATERVLALMHLAGGVLLYIASRQSTFAPIYVIVLMYCLCFMPTLALTNSLSFRHMTDPKREFGSIRVLGTLGWIVAGLSIGAARLEATSVPMRIAAVTSILMGLYCLSLPHTPPLAKAEKLTAGSLFPREAISLLKERSMAVFAIASFLICVPLQFYYAFTNLFLNRTGVADAAGKMSGGQMSELFCMLLIPWLFRRLGVKYILAAGMLAWVLRYVLFAYGNAGPGVWMFWVGILMHGICYDFFFVTGQIFIDRKASAELRAAAQGLISFITYGVGMFVGSWLSGAVVDRYTHVAPDGTVAFDWRSIWMFGAVSSAVVLVAFLFTFSERQSIEESSPVAEAMPGAPL
ncbi:MAG TPA: nucleoside permease, partial [Edaphobacter sp.]|nr:nucleoside permease [Edaphobacter sp.]